MFFSFRYTRDETPEVEMIFAGQPRLKRSHAPPSPTKVLRAVDESVYRRIGKTAMEIFSNPDLVERIVANNLGIISFQSLSMVNKATLAACRSSATLLKSVALFTGAVTKTQLQCLFGVSNDEVKALRSERYNTTHANYSLFYEDAIDAVIEKYGDDAVDKINASRKEVMKTWKPPSSRPRLTNVSKIAKREDVHRREFQARMLV